MNLSELASRPFYTGYRSTFTFRLAEGETAGGVVEDFVRQWIERLSPGSAVVSAWDGYSELDLPGGIFAQEGHSPGASAELAGRAFRLYLPEQVAVADAGERGGVGVPGPTRRRDEGVGQRYHRTTIYVFPAQLRDRPAASVLIQGATDDDSILEAIDEFEVPSVVTAMLSERSCFDGTTRLTASSHLLHRKSVKQAIDAVMDPERTVSVIIASSPGPEADQGFVEVTDSLTRRAAGTATTFVLAASAVETFNSRLPADLQVPRGDVRTFLPHVDLQDPIPGARHRYVGPDTLARALDDDRHVTGFLPTLHARLPRRQMLEQPLAPELLALRSQVDRQARRGRIASLVRSRLTNRQNESAERGLGPEGSASFDNALLSDAVGHTSAPPKAQISTELEALLSKSADISSSLSPGAGTTQRIHTEPRGQRKASQESKSREKVQPVDTGAQPNNDPGTHLTDDPSEEVPADLGATEATVAVLPPSQRPELSTEATGIARVISFLRRWLYPNGHEDVREDTLDDKIMQVDTVLVEHDEEREAALELVEEAQAELDQLSHQLTTAAKELADARADAALAQEEANEHSSKLAFYRKQLIAARQFEALGSELAADDQWQAPGDLHEIASLLSDNPRGEGVREYVTFTGDLASLDAVAQRDTHGHYAAATWSFVHALYDYARARKAGANLNVDLYLRNDEVAGHKVSVHRHALHESDTVRNREDLRRLREFPVPASVDRSGSRFMEAHFRVGSGDGFAPRMYYLDNTGEDGRVYIGYIGRHPKNSLTN